MTRKIPDSEVFDKDVEAVAANKETREETLARMEAIMNRHRKARATKAAEKEKEEEE